MDLVTWKTCQLRDRKNMQSRAKPRRSEYDCFCRMNNENNCTNYKCGNGWHWWWTVVVKFMKRFG